MEFVSPQLEEQLPASHSLVRIFERHPCALVPHDYRSRPVIPLGNDALEVAVFYRMVLGVNRQALVLRIGRRPTWNGPRHQDSVHLQPEVVVRATSGVLLHDKEVPGASCATKGLGRAIGRSLCPVST